MHKFPHLEYQSTMETNFMNITRKIQETGNDPSRIPDMLQARIYTESYEDIMDVYKEFTSSWDLDLIRVKNEITSPLKRITLLFVFCKGIICEIKLEFGKRLVQSNANSLLYFLATRA